MKKPPKPPPKKATELDRYKEALGIARDILSTLYGLRYVADGLARIDLLVPPRARKARRG